METSDYLAFDELARQAHFGRAARKLGSSPSALSRRIQAIEESLGVILVERGPKNVSLTAAGTTFLAFAREEIHRLEALRVSLAEQASEPEGELRLACTVTACYSILPRILAECRKRHPRLSLQVLTQDAAQSFAQLESGEIDLAVIPTDADLPSEYESHPLDRAELLFIGPKSDEDLDRLGGELRSIAERTKGRAIDRRRIARALGNVPFVLQLAGLERKRLLGWLKEYELHPKITAEVRGNEGIIAMVGLGSGLGLVPDLVLDRSPGSVTRLEGLPSPRGYEVSLCARSRSLKRGAVAAFWEIAADQYHPASR